MSRLAPARARALAALIDADRRGVFVRDQLQHDAGQALDHRDEALALRLALGATAASGTLDELLDRYIAKPSRVKPPVRWALRVAAFEILYLDTPARAAVSQGVELVRSRAASAAGLANAVLRRIAEAAPDYLAAADAPAADRAVVSAARRSGLPVWLVTAFRESLGASRARGVIEAELEPAPLAFHLAPTAMFDDVSGRCPAPGMLLPDDAAAFIRSGALACARAVASDEAAQLVAIAATAPGTCLEVGAGRGTKTYVMQAVSARLGWERRHIALDLAQRKGELNRERLERAGLAAGVAFATGDGRALDDALRKLDERAGAPLLFDRVLLDAPCSGTGTMRRHPEIPWRLAPDDVAPAGSLPALQLDLLRAASERVAPGGELIYATCSVLASENRDVVRDFLASDAGAAFQPEPVSAARVFQEPSHADAADLVSADEDVSGMFQSAPVPGARDGHFCARLVRRA